MIAFGGEAAREFSRAAKPREKIPFPYLPMCSLDSPSLKQSTRRRNPASCAGKTTGLFPNLVVRSELEQKLQKLLRQHQP